MSGIDEPEVRDPPSADVAPAGSLWARLVARLKRLRGPIVAFAAVGAVLSGLVGYWNTYRTVRDVLPAVATPTTPTDAGPLSVVVLPFANLTGDPGQAYLADGLTATLTADLSRIQNAFVIDAASAASYRDKALTAQQVGRALGVRFVLQGNVQRSGNKLRINAQLADATSNAQLWSDTYEGELTDLFALQDRITGRIANTMSREMVVVAARESERRQGDPRVVDLILRARALDEKEGALENYKQMERLYRQALAIEPANASAMMGLALALSFEVSNYGQEFSADARDGIWREAIDLATRANAAAPGDPEYYRIVAFHARHVGDWAGHRRAAETMLSLNPKLPPPYNLLANSYLREGEPARAVELLTQAVNLNPKNTGAVFMSNLGRAHFMAGNYKAAIDWAGRALEANPKLGFAHTLLAMAYALDGDDARARAEAAEVRRLDPGFKVDPEKMLAQSATPAYRMYLETKAIPALRKAGLLE